MDGRCVGPRLFAVQQATRSGLSPSRPARATNSPDLVAGIGGGRVETAFTGYCSEGDRDPVQAFIASINPGAPRRAMARLRL